MKINSVNHVCTVLAPDLERPINNCFEICGETFSICTYKFMRGPYGLQGDETPRGYFIVCYSDWLVFHMDVYPERGTYKINAGITRKYAKKPEYISKYERLIPQIESVLINAVTGG